MIYDGDVHYSDTGRVKGNGLHSGYILKEKSTGCSDVGHERKRVVKSLESESGRMWLPFTELGKA